MSRILDFLRSRRVAAEPEPPVTLPWFDQPNAMELLNERRKAERLSDQEFEGLRHWADYGYAELSDLVPQSDLQEMLKDLDNVWTARDPIPALVIDDVKLNPEDSGRLPHEKLVGLSQETRDKLKRQFHWRIHSFYQFSRATNRIYTNRLLQRWASQILGTRADPFNTINFTFGSVQELHQDSGVFYVWPMNYLVGVWIACEDIHPDSGPLVYYPGSHKERLFPRFDDYPRTNLKNCDPGLIRPYAEYLDDVAKRYDRRVFIAKRGDIFLWHGMLIHGGAEIRNPELTRKSYVCHYIPPGCDKSSEAKGPFNW